MSSGLSDLERRVLRYQGLPAREIARLERITVARVLEVWAALKDRGVIPHTPGVEPHPAVEQLTFDQVDRMMRRNCAPKTPANREVGWTTDTEALW